MSRPDGTLWGLAFCASLVLASARDHRSVAPTVAAVLVLACLAMLAWRASR